MVFKTNRDGDATIIEIITNKQVRVKFSNTGFERSVDIHNLRKGKCADLTITLRVKPTRYLNIEMQSNNSGLFTVLEQTSNRYKIVFKDTGFITTVLRENAKVGKVNDPYHKSVYGIGFLGEYVRPYYIKHAYTLWHNMLKRCYCEADNKGYYGRGIEVSKEWLCFGDFLRDIESLTNFDKWIIGQYNKEEIQYNLDKDFAYYGCTVYSKDNCQFIDETLNKGTTSRTYSSRLRIENYNRKE